MITYFKTIENKIEKIAGMEKDCWISVINPSEEEIRYLSGYFALEESFIRAALDAEETSRIEVEDGNTLIVIDVPAIERTEGSDSVIYSTLPMAIILTKDQIITVSLTHTPVIKDFEDGYVKNARTSLKTQFVFTFLLRVAAKFLQYLKQIDKISSHVEKQLHKSMKNKELIQLLELEKSLVYFSTSLKSNEVTIEKILRGRVIKIYDEDQDLLEDVIIEIKQAIEMSNIYTSILSGTMDAFASVISNNLNIVMKTLTSVTIMLSIPTIISSLYGMNVTWLPFNNFWFPTCLSIVAAGLVGVVLYKKKMF